MTTQASVATPYYNPRIVSCPTCNAPKGEPCIGLVAPGCGPHLERYYRARAYLTHPSNQPIAQHGREVPDTNMLNGLEMSANQRDAQLCKCWFCQQTGMQYELDEPNHALVKRVQALHTADGEGFCTTCDYGTPHPCPTTRILDGTE